MSYKGEIVFTNNNPALVLMVGLPFCGIRLLFPDTEKVDTLMLNRVLNQQADSYNGLLTIKNIREALKKGFFVSVYSNSFIDVKSRVEFLENFIDINIPKKCLLDTTPYNVCIPHNKEFLKKFDPKIIDIPTYSEGFSEISPINIDVAEIPDFYHISNMRRRYFDLSTSNKAIKEDNNSQTLLATKYAIDKGFSSLEIISVFLCCTAAELLRELNTEAIYRVSGFDYFSYIRKFTSGLGDCGFEEKDIYECAVAIQQIPLFLNGALSDRENDEFLNAYGFEIFEKANKFAEAILMTKDASCKPEFYQNLYESIIISIGKKLEEEKI